MILNKDFVNDVLKTNRYINSYETIESIDELDTSYNNELEFRTDVITSPIDNSYIDTNRTINVFELNNLMVMFFLKNNAEIKEEIKKENNKIIVNLEIANENKTIKSFLNQKEFEIENFYKELILEKLKLFNSFYLLNLIK